MKNFNKTFLQELLKTPGPSSYEHRPAAVWREQAKKYKAKLRVDSYGNSFANFATKNKKKIMLSGHIDEIGLLIHYIDDNGLLFFKGIGGWDPQQLIGQRIRVMGHAGDIVGIIGKKAIHLMKEKDRKKVSKITDMWIDIGAKSKKDALKYVQIGNAAVIEQPYLELLNNRIASKAIDNRIGAYIVLEAAKRVKNPQVEIEAVASVQEEIGHAGAMMAAYGSAPDFAIAVDVTHATDIPDIKKRVHGDCKLGSGPSIDTGSTNHLGMFQEFIKLAQKHNIAYTINTAPRKTSTDGDDIFKSKGGVPTVVISIPNRYMHSPSEMIDLADLENVINLIVLFIESLDEKSEFKQPS